MDNRRNQKSNKQRKKKTKFRCFYAISFIGITIFCLALLGNAILTKNQTEIPLIPSDSTTESTSKSEDNTDSQNQDSQENAANTAEWELILVNPWNTLPEDFSVEVTNLKNGHAVDKRIYTNLQTMMDDARAEGLSPIICSSYRSKEKQQSLFDNKISAYVAQGYSKEKANEEVAKWIAIPGTSEHQTGLAVDIVASSYQILDKKQEETAEQQWLMQNSYKYGFILRYPTDKSEVTGISYEPWHYRYVGEKAAKEIFEQGVCLEEYLAK